MLHGGVKSFMKWTPIGSKNKPRSRPTTMTKPLALIDQSFLDFVESHEVKVSAKFDMPRSFQFWKL